MLTKIYLVLSFSPFAITNITYFWHFHAWKGVNHCVPITCKTALLYSQFKSLSKSKQKISVKMKLQNSSWSGNWKVKFWKFEAELISFCLAFILTSYLIQMILVPSFQLTILSSKDSNKISSTLTSPRLRDEILMQMND